ncbi:MAG: hypothetical protein AB7P04_13245 [Bacteriovoracia bacterium]
MKTHGQHPQIGGFTLIETTITLAILMSAIWAHASMESQSRRWRENVARRWQAQNTAENIADMIGTLDAEGFKALILTRATGLSYLEPMRSPDHPWLSAWLHRPDQEAIEVSVALYYPTHPSVRLDTLPVSLADFNPFSFEREITVTVSYLNPSSRTYVWTTRLSHD